MKFSKHSFRRMERQIFKKRVGSFYRPFLELFAEADIYRPEGKDFVCQMTGLQCVTTFVFVALWVLGLLLLSYILSPLDSFGVHIALLAMIFTFPYVIEGPRFLLPWRCVQKHELYVVRWKSKWGFTLALFFGFVVGLALSFLLSPYL